MNPNSFPKDALLPIGAVVCFSVLFAAFGAAPWALCIPLTIFASALIYGFAVVTQGAAPPGCFITIVILAMSVMLILFGHSDRAMHQDADHTESLVMRNKSGHLVTWWVNPERENTFWTFLSVGLGGIGVSFIVGLVTVVRYPRGLPIPAAPSPPEPPDELRPWHRETVVSGEIGASGLKLRANDAHDVAFNTIKCVYMAQVDAFYLLDVHCWPPERTYRIDSRTFEETVPDWFGKFAQAVPAADCVEAPACPDVSSFNQASMARAQFPHTRA